MTIKQHGGIFGRNPTFNDVDVDGTLNIDGSALFGSGVTVNTGNLVIGTSGQGIDFSVGAGGASTSNLLDEYEEGTFSPAYQSVTGGSWTYSSQVGTYTRVGRLVTARGAITVSAGSGLSGNIAVNLPYSSSANTTGTLMVSNLSKTVDSQLTLFTVGANTRIYEFRNNGPYAAANYSSLGSTHSLFFDVTYEV